MINFFHVILKILEMEYDPPRENINRRFSRFLLSLRYLPSGNESILIGTKFRCADFNVPRPIESTKVVISPCSLCVDGLTPGAGREIVQRGGRPWASQLKPVMENWTLAISVIPIKSQTKIIHFSGGGPTRI